MNQENQNPLFTVITDVFWRLDLFKSGIESVLHQSYKNLEIVVINNGASKDIRDFIKEISLSDKRLKILEFNKNHFSWEDPGSSLKYILNEALKLKVTGKYVFYKSFDDLLSKNYVQSMVNLFKENPSCITALGRPISMNDNGIDQFELDDKEINIRPRYMSGKDLVVDYINEGNLYRVPGGMLTLKTTDLINVGGWDRHIDLSHFLRVLPFGVTGTDNNAFLYWRRHSDQLNKKLNVKGHVGALETYSLIEDTDLKERWDKLDKGLTKTLISFMTRRQLKTSAKWFILNLFNFRFKSIFITLSEERFNLLFLVFLPKYVWRYKMMFIVRFIKIFRPLLKPIFIYVDKSIPSLKGRSILFSRALSFLIKG